MYDAGKPKSELCGNLDEQDGERGGREVAEGGGVCIPNADSC